MDAHRLVAPAWGLFFLTVMLSATPAGGAVHAGPTPAPHRWLLLDGRASVDDLHATILDDVLQALAPYRTGA